MYENLIPLTMNRFAMFDIKVHQMPNAIGMWPNEQECLIWCVLNAPPGNWMEIGAFCGGSAVLMGLASQDLSIAGLKQWPHNIYSVDINFNEMYDQNVYGRGKFSTLIHKLECDSNDLNGYYSGETLGFAFIDGYHSFQQVVDDFTIVDEWIAPDGIIGFHDVSPMMHKDENTFNNYIERKHEETKQAGFANNDSEDFLLDEAVAYILLHCHTSEYRYERVEIPVRRDVRHFKETGLTRWTRGKTSPFNSYCAIRKVMK